MSNSGSFRGHEYDVLSIVLLKVRIIRVKEMYTKSSKNTRKKDSQLIKTMVDYGVHMSQ